MSTQAPRGRGRGGGRGGYGDRGGGRGGRGYHGGGRGRGGGRGKGPPRVFRAPAEPNVEGRVLDIENKYHAEASQLSLDSLSLKRQFPLRPGYGQGGNRVSLWANYFRMSAKPETVLFRYAVEVKAPAKATEPKGRKLKRIFELLLQDNFQNQRDQVATDFKANLISQDRLEFETKVFDVPYRDEHDDTPPPDPKVYQVRVQAAGTLTLKSLLDHLASPSANDIFDGKEELIQALNIVVGHSPKTNPGIITIGANRHIPMGPDMESWDLQQGLQALRGYFVSVRAATARLLVNVQVKNIACYMPGSLAALMNASGKLRHKGALEQFLKGLRVQLTHLQKTKGNKRIMRVKTIAGLASPRNGRGLDHPPRVSRIGAGPQEVQFYLSGPLPGGPAKTETQGGKKGKKGGVPPKDSGAQPKDHGYISVYEYFMRVHNVKQMDPGMPVINVGNMQNPSYLPVEVCFVEAGQPCNTKLSPGQTREMIKFAVRNPADNAQSIYEKGARIIGASPTVQLLNNMGLSIEPKLVTVAGRVLQGPSVRYKESSINPRGASWNLAGVKFPRGASLTQWGVMVLGSTGHDISESVETFITTAKAHGLQVPNPTARFIFNESFGPQDDSDEHARKVDRAFDQILAKYPGIKILLIALPLEDAAIYNRVKYRGDIRDGIHTICVHPRKFNGVQYCANIALKFNLKLGGVNHVLDAAKYGLISEGKTMLVGIDVTHPSPGSSSKAPSVAALVASIDKDLAQWPATIRLQKEAKMEMVDALQEMLESRLHLWHRKNNAYPENILIYRDGVSEGQYARVLEEELPLLRKACERVYPATMTKRDLPRMSIVVVGKRHNTRFYPVRVEEADGSSNPQNGTVVDRVVTENRNWDFYLQAHTALQGTARPAHYFVILNEIIQAPKNSSLTAADVLEQLTHNLCYLFGRATKAVSVCPPAYYADLACERARRYLSGYYDATPTESLVSGETSRDPSEDELRIHRNLENSMFYI